MYLVTDRLIIRSMELADAKAYIEMASDGSLDEDIFSGWHGDYRKWLPEWVRESIFEYYDIPKMIATIRNENVSSWKVAEKAGFVLVETKMYQDFNDDRVNIY